MESTAAPTYEQLVNENQQLREQLGKSQQQVLEELVELLMADDTPLIRVKAEAYEYRIYELELHFMFQQPGSLESTVAQESMERVTANYHRDYPARPLQPKPRPVENPTPYTGGFPRMPAYKERKPYTRKVKPAA